MGKIVETKIKIISIRDKKESRLKYLETEKKRLEKKGYKFKEYIENGKDDSYAIFEVDEDILKKDKYKKYLGWIIFIFILGLLFTPNEDSIKDNNAPATISETQTEIAKNITQEQPKEIKEKPQITIEDKLKKYANLPTAKRIEKFLKDRGGSRDIKTTENPLTISLTTIGVRNDIQEVTQNLIYRGFFYGAFWSFVVDDTIDKVTIKVYLRDMSSYKIFKKATMTISRNSLMTLLNYNEFVSNDIKDFVTIDEFNFMQLDGVAEKIYNHSKVLTLAISVLSGLN